MRLPTDDTIEAQKVIPVGQKNNLFSRIEEMYDTLRILTTRELMARVAARTLHLQINAVACTLVSSGFAKKTRPRG
ncbi:MAG: hypothetical protein PWR02_496 [Synergistales bacterium]|nr:hypothetical protein [Synergistales bacterium]MDN5335470.1 hypothetical protein [Synergistales bacterium]